MKKITLLLLLTANIIFAQNFTDHIIDSATDGVSTSFVVDVDTDGDLDLVSVSYVADELAWYENDGAQNFTKHSIDAAVNGAIYVNAGDGDGDGDIDILINTYDGDEVIIYFNDGSENFTKQIVDANLNGSNYNAVIDIDGDLDLDIFAVGFDDNSLVMYENDGAFNFTKTTIDAFLTGASSVVVEDIDGDTDFDLLVTSFGGYGTTVDGEVSWYENDGSQNFTKHSVDANLVSPATAYTVDFDADGDQDFILSDSEGNELSWYENDGTQNFTKHSVDTAINYPTYAHAVDFNNDGNLDIITSATNDNELIWYENDGSQNFTKHVISSTLGDSFGLFSADIDQDGDFDVAVASLGVDTLRWYENDFISPPANDLAINAIAISCGNIITGDTTNATIDAQGICGNALDDSNNVWYTFTGSGSAEDITLSTCSSNSVFDTIIAVFTGAPGALVCLANNDDDNACFNDLLSTVTFTSDGTTTYYIKVQGYDEVEFGMFEMNVVCATVTVEDLTAYNFNYYPNPVNDTLTLTANNTINAITIYNMLGQEVKSLTTSLTEVEVDLTNLNTGTYFVKVQIEDRVGTFKIIKK